jgi:amino acid adenylation domain-containing protein
LNLQQYLVESARRFPDRDAVGEAAASPVSYAGLDALSDRLRDRLSRIGVAPGDRVGLFLPKSVDSVAAIFGILKRGAAYVPADPTAPATRAAYILADCGVKAVVVDARLSGALAEALRAEGASPELLVLDEVGGGRGLDARLAQLDAEDAAPAVPTHASGPDDLAYVLYTSGSTGKPKGVMLSHRNATSFVEWCSDSFSPRTDDCFSSHAPFHFDLSILDLYVPVKHGARLVLIPEDVGKDPSGLAALIAETRITVWYSTPAILAMLAEYGKLETRDYGALRIVLFAGEVFPIVHLRATQEKLPHPAYFNLYGPTETNVCTYHPIPSEIPPDRTEPFPIGRVCSQLEGRVVDADGADVAPGDEGELLIRGPNVMQGYWNLPEQSAAGFLGDDPATRWYRTGDLVVDEGGGVLRYVGRRDRMVKKRGFRIELGEIEACLYRHPDVSGAAAVALQSDEGVRIVAHLATRDGERISIIALKRFCTEHLPGYMVPDAFRFHESLPKTSTDKIDYQGLEKLE